MKYRGFSSSPSPTPVVETRVDTLTRDEKVLGPFSTLSGCTISVGMTPSTKDDDTTRMKRIQATKCPWCCMKCQTLQLN